MKGGSTRVCTQETLCLTRTTEHTLINTKTPRVPCASSVCQQLPLEHGQPLIPQPAGHQPRSGLVGRSHAGYWRPWECRACKLGSARIILKTSTRVFYHLLHLFYSELHGPLWLSILKAYLNDLSGQHKQLEQLLAGLCC